MVKRNNPEKQLEKLMQTEFVGQLEDVIIFQNSDNSYELFNMYHINKNDNNDISIFEDINGLNNYEFDDFNKNLKEYYFDMCEKFDNKITNYCYFYAYKNISSIEMILNVFNINEKNIIISNNNINRKTIKLNLFSDKDYKIYRFINTFKKIIQMIHKKVFDRMIIITKIIYPLIVANYQKFHYKLVFDKNEDEPKEFILHSTFSNCVHDVLHDIIENDIIKEMKFEEDEEYKIKREKILEKIENHKKTIMMIDEIKQKNEMKIKCYDSEDDSEDYKKPIIKFEKKKSFKNNS